MRNNSKILKGGFHNRNKRPSNRPGRGDDVTEEPSKTQQKEKTAVPKKEKKEKGSQILQHSEEEPSVQGKKKGGKEKEKVTVPPNVEKIVDEYVTSHCDVRKIHADFLQMQEKIVVGDKQHLKCCQYADRNRHADVPCLDETRVVLEPKEGEKDSCDYIHANKLFFDERQFLVAQAPKQNTLEDFWRMVFQNQCAAVVVLCPFYEQGHESSENFWPMNTNDYKYYGKMFINNKKVEHTSSGDIYTIEVLPDGCSNSLLMKIHHFTTWENENINVHNSRAILRLMRAVKTTETGVTAVVSSTGVGRACAYVLIDIVTIRLFKGTPTKLVDVASEIRKKRAHAFRNEEAYLSAAYIILDYIRAKLPKHSTAVKEFNDSIGNLDP